ncbi:HAMP domain-containing histidine kinase [Chitinophaga sp. G-6-1-13]|uniref:HAMP domain-containing histidine kinase n=1 Tax=Chitinophaga fulva TaxID=2728842 RepID=A0A848GGY1_9BACT|nr:HAMP domain-containing histidine kinase [Chitinophaga fulva]NML37087.1 HAMP domain-containing histidine kinase [Chitinophaga fulva]
MRQCYIAALACLICCQLTAQVPQMPELRRELLQQHDSAGYLAVLGKISALYDVIDVDSSFQYAVKIRDMAARLHDARGQADANDLMSWYYALKTDFGVAGIYAYKALKIHEQLGDSARIAKTLSNIYVYYRNMGRRKDANNYFYQAFKMASQLPPGNDSVYGILLVNYVMRFYKDSTHADSVRWALKRARQVIEEYPRSKISFYVDAYSLNDLVEKGQGRKAEETIYQLADNALRSGMPYVAMDMYGRLDDFPRMGYHPDTVRYQEKAYALGVQTGSIELNLYWLARLYDYYSRKKDAAHAVQYGREIMRLAAEKRYQPNAHSFDYIEIFLKEKAVSDLRQQNRHQQQVLAAELTESDNNQLIVVGILIMVVLFLALFLGRYWHYQRLKQQDEALLRGYREMAAANQALTETDAFKNKLISILARDFRGPLVHLTAVAARFKSGNLSKAEMASFLKHISITSGKVLEVFDNILKWLRLQLSGYRYEPVRCLLLPLIQSALGPLEAELVRKQIIVKNYIPGSAAVLMDEEMLKLVNIQLLQIAVAVAQAGSMLEITVDRAMGQTEVYIRVKTGEDTHFVLAGLENWQDNGLALGLVISRDLMKMMNGYIIAEGQEHSYLAFGYILP